MVYIYLKSKQTKEYCFKTLEEYEDFINSMKLLQEFSKNNKTINDMIRFRSICCKFETEIEIDGTHQVYQWCSICNKIDQKYIK
jgi:hypothetical protein